MKKNLFTVLPKETKGNNPIIALCCVRVNVCMSVCAKEKGRER